MVKFFSAIKLGYEILAALLAARAAQPYVWFPILKGVRYRVTIEVLPPEPAA